MFIFHFCRAVIARTIRKKQMKWLQALTIVTNIVPHTMCIVRYGTIRATYEKYWQIFCISPLLGVNLVRSFTKEKELMRPGFMSFATNYLTLRSILESKARLNAMFDFTKWNTSPYIEKGDAVVLGYSILVNKNFWSKSSIVQSAQFH